MTPDDRPRIAMFRIIMGAGSDDRVMSIWPRIRMAVTLTLAFMVKATAREQVFDESEPEDTQSTLLILPIRRLTGTLMARVIARVPVLGHMVSIRMAGGATLGHRVTGRTFSAISFVMMTSSVNMAVKTGWLTKNPENTGPGTN